MFQIGDRRSLIADLGTGCAKYVVALNKGDKQPQSISSGVADLSM
jgi:hypothetical protein